MKHNQLPLSSVHLGYNVTPISIGHNSIEIPHAETLRDSYTVPRAKACTIIALSFNMARTFAYTSNGQASYIIKVKSSDGKTTELFRLAGFLVAVGDSLSASIPLNYPLRPFDVVTVYTEDLSTGGIVGFAGSVIIAETDVIQP